MSAVSAEFSRAPANAAAPAHRSGGSGEPPSSEQDTGDLDAETKQRGPGAKRTPGADFGPNEWLVDELYQQYQADPGSVDRAWWNFFADYRPEPIDSRRPQAPAQAQAPVQRPGAAAASSGAPGRQATTAAPAAPGTQTAPAAPPGAAPGAAPSQAPRPGQEVPDGQTASAGTSRGGRGEPASAAQAANATQTANAAQAPQAAQGASTLNGVASEAEQ